MGELGRVVHIREVVGSIPISPTKGFDARRPLLLQEWPSSFYRPNILSVQQGWPAMGQLETSRIGDEWFQQRGQT